MSDTPDPATHISAGELREQAQFARQGNYAGVSGDLDTAANYIDALVLANDRLRAEVERLRKDHQEWLKADRNLLRETIEERDRLAADLNNAKYANEHAVLALKDALAENERWRKHVCMDPEDDSIWWSDEFVTDLKAENEKLLASRDAHMAGCLEAETELRLARAVVVIVKNANFECDEFSTSEECFACALHDAIAAYDASQTAANHDGKGETT